MPHDGQDRTMTESPLLAGLLGLTSDALPPAEALLETATARVREAVTVDGRVSGPALEAHQTAAHGLAWLATYVESLRQMQGWAERLQEKGEFGDGAGDEVVDDRVAVVGGGQVLVVSTCSGQACAQFSVDGGAADRDQPAQEPGDQRQPETRQVRRDQGRACMVPRVGKRLSCDPFTFVDGVGHHFRKGFGQGNRQYRSEQDGCRRLRLRHGGYRYGFRWNA